LWNGYDLLRMSRPIVKRFTFNIALTNHYKNQSHICCLITINRYEKLTVIKYLKCKISSICFWI